MESYKVMLAQAKATKYTFLTACGGGAGRERFQGAKKRLAKGEYLNAFVANAINVFLKNNKIFKAKASSESGL